MSNYNERLDEILTKLENSWWNTENCKEISGKGLTAEEARIKWGLDDTYRA